MIDDNKVNRKVNLPSDEKSNLHPRNKNNTRYNFTHLIGLYPDLKQFVFTNKYGRETINFALPEAVRILNQVLLKQFYGIQFWDIPKDYLCPPVPGRADYIHYVADLLSSSNSNIIPRGNSVSVLDIGVGANCIFPIIGRSEYGWRFTGSDVDPAAITSARKIITANDFPDGSIEIRHQRHKQYIFREIIGSDEQFDLTICNPPFHSSQEQAEAGARRKWKNLGLQKQSKTILNFGGQHTELLYDGGDEAFIHLMIRESFEIRKNVFWFSTLVSKQSLILNVKKELQNVNAEEIRIIEMAQGQKKSRILAWTFLTNEEQRAWKLERWNKN